MMCCDVMEMVYEQDISLINRIQIELHLLVCQDCARKAERLRMCRDILQTDFLPAPPGLEHSIMAMIHLEENEAPQPFEAEAPGGFSTKGWVIAGIIMLVSLVSVFFGMDFNNVVIAAGISFMIPVGITIGIALTCYGALFIGSHLKELTERFGL